MDEAAEAVPLAQRNRVEPLTLPDLRGSARRRRVIYAVIALAAAGAAFAFWPREEAEDLLRTERAEVRDVARVISLTGHLDARTRVEVPAPTAALLNQVLVKTGAKVAADDPLAALDSRQADLNLTAAQAQARAATAQRDQARVLLDAATQERQRQQTLLSQGLVSEAELAAARAREQQAQTTLRAAQAQIGAASTTVGQARLSRDFVMLRSPIAGVVLRTPNTTGGVVGPDRGPLFIIGSDLSTMRIDATVGEADVGAIEVGQQATFEVPAFVGRTFTARVTHIVPMGDVQAGTTSYTIELEAPNADGDLLPGMTTMLSIEVARANRVLTVPEAALRFTPENAPSAPSRSRVWVRTGPNRLEPVEVTAGVSDGGFTEVTVEGNALAAGADVVIGMDLSEASDGANVTLGSSRRRRGN